jgi:glucose/arabinose dehydrogenase
MNPIALFLAILLAAPLAAAALFEEPPKNERIVLIGNGFGERLQYGGNFETQLHLRYPEHRLTLRNLCYPGDTPAYRPRAGRASPWAIPGGEALRPEFARHRGEGQYPSDDEWLAICKADTILAFFGYNESFDGEAGLPAFRAELDAFVTHTLSQKYNGRSAPTLVLVSPIAFEDLSDAFDLPDGRAENARLKLYAGAMKDVAAARQVHFLDLFTPTLKLFEDSKEHFTFNGFALNDAGDRRLAHLIADAIYRPAQIILQANPDEVRKLVIEKSWFWHNDYRMPNGIHVHGRRRQPFGAVNYPGEIEKIRRMTAHRDEAIWQAVANQPTDLAAADAKLPPLDPVESNVAGPIRYLKEAEALEKFTVRDGFKIELFASEYDFPDLANPVQMTFDAKGRLWVATMPGYPHYRPGDPLPDDKILILEDTDGDHRADKQTIFADGLHLPSGFKLAPEGVYVSQQPNLLLLRDIDVDGKADRREVLLNGFDPHDTRHAIGAFTSDAGGSLYLAEGAFLHSQIETPYGPRRGDGGGGIWRFDPKTWRLERQVQTRLDNPWGIAFDDWEQCFIADASDGESWWALPLSAKAPFGHEIPKVAPFVPQRARPTSGAEFISSRHFPDDMQGGFLICNLEGFQGASIAGVRDDEGGFGGKLDGDLVASSDPNFRPCDLEFALDGSLYLLDWHNPLIGHAEHSARDPKRDKSHGRIYRITHKTRPLATAPPIHDASIPQLFAALKEPEYRTRYRARRELRGKKPEMVVPAAKAWIATLDKADPRYEHHLCEALWATWAQNQPDREILGLCLAARSPQARAAAVQVLRHAWRKIPDHLALLLKAANDPHPRVRLEAIVAASWLDNPDGARIALEAFKHPVDKWMPHAIRTAFMTLGDDVEALRKDGQLDLSANPRAADFLAGKLELPGLEPR